MTVVSGHGMIACPRLDMRKETREGTNERIAGQAPHAGLARQGDWAGVLGNLSLGKVGLEYNGMMISHAVR